MAKNVIGKIQMIKFPKMKICLPQKEKQKKFHLPLRNKKKQQNILNTISHEKKNRYDNRGQTFPKFILFSSDIFFSALKHFKKSINEISKV